MAIEPEFVRLIKRWILPDTNKEEGQPQRTTNAASTSAPGVKPIQLDDEEDDLR